MTVGLFVAAALVAIGDWLAVARRLHHLELILKPLTLVLLIGAAASADLGSPKSAVLAALALGLLGDVALLRSQDDPARPDPAFMIGLGAFLLGHIGYVIAFALAGERWAYFASGALVVAGVAGLALPDVLSGARQAGGHGLQLAVAAYAAALGAMTIFAVGTGEPLVAAGGVLFLFSDVTLARGRFVRGMRLGPLSIIVSYHAAQGLMLAGLITR